MWCFLDESYPPEGNVTAVVACLMQSATVRRLDREMFLARRNRLGEGHARDLKRELKGQWLLSNQSFKLLAKYGHSTNQDLVNDVLNASFIIRSQHPIYLFGAVVRGARDLLTNPGGTQLAKPLVQILRRVSRAAIRLNPKDRVNLVFDEQIGTRADVSIRARRFISGVRLPNVSHYPLSSVSNVSPGIQLADIGAYILGRRGACDHRFDVWMARLRRLEWRETVHGRHTSGIMFFNREENGSFSKCRAWHN